MAILTLPQARVPIGWATVSGTRVPVEIDMEWMRSLSVLVERAGGVSGIDGIANLVTQEKNRASIAEGLALTAANTAQDNVEEVVALLNTQLALIYDPDADPPTMAYVCEAPPGTLDSAAEWRVQKLTFDVDGGVTSLWADGNSNFDNVAANRAALTYS